MIEETVTRGGESAIGHVIVRETATETVIMSVSGVRIRTETVAEIEIATPAVKTNGRRVLVDVTVHPVNEMTSSAMGKIVIEAARADEMIHQKDAMTINAVHRQRVVTIGAIKQISHRIGRAAVAPMIIQTPTIRPYHPCGTITIKVVTTKVETNDGPLKRYNNCRKWALKYPS